MKTTKGINLHITGKILINFKQAKAITETYWIPILINQSLTLIGWLDPRKW